MVSKRGDGKYWWIISFIMAIMVGLLLIYIIFQEYWTKSDVDWETCRQSVLLRSGDLDFYAKEIQEGLPFKFKTQAIEIKYKDLEKAKKEIADATRATWYMFGEGEAILYDPRVFAVTDYCFVSSRIYFDKDVQDFYKGKLNVGEILNMKIPYKEQTYVQYTNFSIPENELMNVSVIDPSKDLFVIYRYKHIRFGIDEGEFVFRIWESKLDRKIVLYQGNDFKDDVACSKIETIPG